jgi:peptidyl-prolyl cis-trans isomerase B (cyclophilin B)
MPNITETTVQSLQYGGKLPSVHDGLAITSLICAFFFPPLGVIFGHVSNRIALQEGRLRSGLAVAGVVLGCIGTIGWLILFIALLAAVARTGTGSYPVPSPTG